MDLHEDIHRVIENYLDENEFRRWLNSALQNSRGVTFLLQKRKAKWADFDDWYGAWQQEARGNPVLGWGVHSRNRIVKEEDLRTFSQAIISYYGERLEEAQQVLTVPPDTTVEDMLASFAKIIALKPTDRKGWVRIRRRWIDDQLPEHELVAALREIYANVARVVIRAHSASKVPTCLAPEFNRPCVTAEIDPELKCLGQGDPIPTGILDISTGEIMKLGYGRFERDDSLVGLGRKRYGMVPVSGVDAIEHAVNRMELSKRFLEADGYSGPMLLLLRGLNDIRVHPIAFGIDEPRELKVATTVEINGAWQYDGAVFASETWIWSERGRGSLVGLPPEELLSSNDEFFDPDQQGGRDEALVVYGLAADGRFRVLLQPFARTRHGIAYGELSDTSEESMLPLFLRPVWRRWPKWRNGPPSADDDESTI
jgi:hypothetical protein